MPPDPLSPSGAAIHDDSSMDEDDPPQLSGYIAKLNDMMREKQCNDENRRESNVFPRVDSFSSLSTLSSSATDVVDSEAQLEIDFPSSFSLPARRTRRGGSIMSARSLEQSLKGDSYREAARQRRLSRRGSSVLSLSSHQGEDGTCLTDQEDLSVSFSTVEVREYGIELGDNPGVSAGPPLTIKWDHLSEKKFDVDTYESHLPPRRKHKEMAIPYKERWRRLSEGANLTDDQIFEGTKLVNITRFNRARTLKSLKGARFEERMESMKRWVGRNFLHRSQKRREERMIKETLERDRRETEKRLAEDLYQ